MVYLLKFWKPILCVLLMALLSVYSYRQGAKTCESDGEEVTKISEKERVEQRTTRNTRVTERPDGTRVTEVEEKIDTKTDRKTKTNKTIDPRKQYRIGGSIEKPINKLRESSPSFNIHFGTRLYKDLWIESHYNFNKKELGLGLSVEF